MTAEWEDWFIGGPPPTAEKVFMSTDMPCRVPRPGSAHTDPRIVRIYEGQQVAIDRN